MRIQASLAARGSWPGSISGENGAYLLDELRQMYRCHLVDDRLIGASIIVDEPVPHARDQRPGNGGMGLLEAVRQLPGGFAHDLDPIAGGEQGFTVGGELLSGRPSDNGRH